MSMVELTKDYGYTVNELMAVYVARNLSNGDMGYNGIGSGGRAFTLAVGIPLVAGALAQNTHAPDYTILQDVMINPRMDQLPSKWTSAKTLGWNCDARVSVYTANEYFQSGHVTVGFVSAAQIDKYGNTNITSIGDYRKPKVRLIGALAQTEHLAFTKKTFILNDHEPRTFVEKVDFRTGVGYGEGLDYRRRIGLRPYGPEKMIKIVTDLAILGFDGQGRMQIDSIHPWTTVEEVQSKTGFELVVPDSVPYTAPPTEAELELIRKKIDPNCILLGDTPWDQIS
jgi:glutaconate CoA-transferase subunit B